jgi:hypothetical protein
VNLPSVGPPTAVLGTALGVDYTLRRGFLFGGRPRIGGGSASDELYRLDFATGTWTAPVPNSPKPTARAGSRMVYSPTQRVLYVAGGCASVDQYGLCSGTVFADLWGINVDPANGGL